MRSLDLSKEKKHDIANILPEKVEESELNQDQRESKEVLELPNLNSEYTGEGSLNLQTQLLQEELLEIKHQMLKFFTLSKE
jgi:hypothetical protein